MAGQNVLLLVLTGLLPLVFFVTIVGNYKGNNIGNISDKYYIEITPAGWTFSIWGLIYLWQVTWIVYSVINLFRRTDEGPLYTNPVLLPASFLVLYIANLVFNSTWIFVFTSELLLAAFSALFAMTLTLVVPLAISYKTLDQNKDLLIKQGRQTDITLIRALVQNGLALYGTWCAIATLLNLAIVLVYVLDILEQKDASTVALSLLAAVILAYSLSDFCCLDRYSRYTLTPYFVYVVALVGSLSKNYVAGERNTIITMVLLAMSGAATLIKITLTLYRHFNGYYGNRHVKQGFVKL